MSTTFYELKLSPATSSTGDPQEQLAGPVRPLLWSLRSRGGCSLSFCGCLKTARPVQVVPKSCAARRVDVPAEVELRALRRMRRRESGPTIKGYVDDEDCRVRAGMRLYCVAARACDLRPSRQDLGAAWPVSLKRHAGAWRTSRQRCWDSKWTSGRLRIKQLT